MANRRGFLVLGGAALAIIAMQRGLPYLRSRFAPLDREPIAGAPGFQRLIGVNGVTTAGGFDPLVGLSDQDDSPAATLPEDLTHALFPGPIQGIPLAVFTDYNCPNCRSFERNLDAVRAEYDTTLFLHHLPLLGPSSVFGARIALAAERQNASAAVHREFMSSRMVIDEAYVARIADKLGLEARALIRDAARPEVARHIARSKGLAHRLGVIGTPGVVIDRTFILGTVPETVLHRVFAESRHTG